jgi:hypothetical protein
MLVNRLLGGAGHGGGGNAARLRSDRRPFFALSEEALPAFRQQVNAGGALRALDPARSVDRATLDPASIEVADALELLRRLHTGDLIFDRPGGFHNRSIVTLCRINRCHPRIGVQKKLSN